MPFDVAQKIKEKKAVDLLILAALKNYHILNALNNRYLFLTVLDAASPRSGCQHGWVLVSSLLCCRLLTAAANFSLCPHIEEKAS